MIVSKNIPLIRLVRWTSWHMLCLTLWAFFSVSIYLYSGLTWLSIPWLPVSLIGTAVAFYVGFKNDAAYDRMWEARTIWGAIVNSSRSWGISVKAFVSNQFRDEQAADHEIIAFHRKLIYRHIAWLYALRSQLLTVKEWEHAAQGGKTGRLAKHYRKRFGIGLIDDEITKEELTQFLEKEEYERTIHYQNTATQLVDSQSADLQRLRELDLIDDFRHMTLQRILMEFYEHQGKCERIKNFPLPRQYANSSSVFVYIFLLLLPFGMVSEFAKFGDYGPWWSIPFIVLVGWVFIVMESIGDFSENPFQGMANDIPMYSLCRTIEIDLLEMLDESELPEAIQPKDGILM